MFRVILTALIILVASSSSVWAEDTPTLKIGLAKFGTVNWEIDTVLHHGLDKKHGLNLVIKTLAHPGATKVALQGRSVDAAVADWLWVSRQRASGKDLVWTPYSGSVGGLVVPGNSNLFSLADLEGKKIGVAGGPVDKSWLLLRAYAKKVYDIDLAEVAEPVFAAPPLLSKKLESGELDAVLTFWHYVARLEAKGYRKIIGAADVANSFGLDAYVPLLGYVIDGMWVRQNPKGLNAFVAAYREAKSILKTSDAEWERLRPITRAKDDATLMALRDGYRAGIPETWGQADISRATKLYAILAELGGEKLVGSSTELAQGVFARDVKF